MRMRKKKNLDSRFSAVEEYLIKVQQDQLTVPEIVWLTHPCMNRDQFKSDKAYGKEPQKHLIDTKEIFGNNNPLRMEIGCGKGQFAMEIAKQNPDVNFIAVEINQSVIVQACEKAQKENLTNLRFLLLGAEKLPIYIEKESVEMIYLNFSTPFPKKNQAKHRLTHENFLNMYKHIMKKDAAIFQKTDNMGFFEFSLCEFSRCGFVLSNVSLDLHSSDYEGNIVTEYEKRFSDLGQPIYRLEARLP